MRVETERVEDRGIERESREGVRVAKRVEECG